MNPALSTGDYIIAGMFDMGKIVTVGEGWVQKLAIFLKRGFIATSQRVYSQSWKVV